MNESICTTIKKQLLRQTKKVTRNCLLGLSSSKRFESIVKLSKFAIIAILVTTLATATSLELCPCQLGTLSQRVANDLAHEQHFNITAASPYIQTSAIQTVIPAARKQQISIPLFVNCNTPQGTYEVKITAAGTTQRKEYMQTITVPQSCHSLRAELTPPGQTPCIGQEAVYTVRVYNDGRADERVTLYSTLSPTQSRFSTTQFTLAPQTSHPLLLFIDTNSRMQNTAFEITAASDYAQTTQPAVVNLVPCGGLPEITANQTALQPKPSIYATDVITLEQGIATLTQIKVGNTGNAPALNAQVKLATQGMEVTYYNPTAITLNQNDEATITILARATTQNPSATLTITSNNTTLLNKTIVVTTVSQTLSATRSQLLRKGDYYALSLAVTNNGEPTHATLSLKNAGDATLSAVELDLATNSTKTVTATMKNNPANKTISIIVNTPRGNYEFPFTVNEEPNATTGLFTATTPTTTLGIAILIALILALILAKKR